MLGVRPVVRDLARGVEPHDVGRAVGPRRCQAALHRRLAPTGTGCMPEGFDRAVHRAAVHVDDGGLLRVRSPLVEGVRVVVRPTAGRAARIGQARRERPVRSARDPVRAGERPEVVIERPVLLHDEDQMVDVVEPERRIHAVRPIRPRNGAVDGRCRASGDAGHQRQSHDRGGEHEDGAPGDHHQWYPGGSGSQRAWVRRRSRASSAVSTAATFVSSYGSFARWYSSSTPAVYRT